MIYEVFTKENLKVTCNDRILLFYPSPITNDRSLEFFSSRLYFHILVQVYVS